MKPFLNEDFLLETPTAALLYHNYAAKMPIIDYHSHLIPEQIAGNKAFDNLTQPWLYGDHYKWRAMRTNGVDEYFCTGAATDEEKFLKWAETVPHTIRNPLYHWTHLELQRYFGVNRLLNPQSAGEIYHQTAGMLKQEEYRVHGLVKKMNVEVICTTDDPIDSLEFHLELQSSNATFRVFPTWRPDNAVNIEKGAGFSQYIKKLGAVCNVEISTYRMLLEALAVRHDFFHQVGCRLSDHGLETFYATDYTLAEIEAIFAKGVKNEPLSEIEMSKYKSAVLYDLAVMDARKGWIQQFHVGALRNNNTRLLSSLGPDTGFDSIGDWLVAQQCARFLDRLDADNMLAKTILYNLNPSQNEVLATMIGNFQDGSVPGKIQFGSGWWFLDQKDGMERQINALSSLGLLSRFVGMLTDSRSFLSFPRHEYFRRLLCNVLGNDVEKGLIPNDEALLGEMVENICYGNAKQYFGFDV